MHVAAVAVTAHVPQAAHRTRRPCTHAADGCACFRAATVDRIHQIATACVTERCMPRQHNEYRKDMCHFLLRQALKSQLHNVGIGGQEELHPATGRVPHVLNVCRNRKASGDGAAIRSAPTKRNCDSDVAGVELQPARLTFGCATADRLPYGMACIALHTR